MASVLAVETDAQVTIKVSFLGVTRRTKMPLRDMVPESLEKSIRTFLHIPAEPVIFIERYSDSAAAYVMLQAENAAVYKQLYRAAKAKSKLKLRVTLKDLQDKPAPKPVTIEDEPESSSPADATTISSTHSPAPSLPRTEAEAEVEAEVEVEAEAATAPTSAVTPGQPSLPLRQATRQSTGCLMDCEPLRNVPTANPVPLLTGFDLENRLQSLLEHNNGVATHLAEHQQKIRAILNHTASPAVQGVAEAGVEPTASSAPQPAPLSPPESPTTLCGIAGPGFAVCCNSCEAPMPDAHYHCSTCDDGDFDLCQPCVERGITCYSNEHWLIKRSIVDNHIVASTTEKVAPKLKQKVQKEEPKQATAAASSPKPEASANPCAHRWSILGNMRTCNSCIKELPEKEFLHCDTCADYDLCQRCFAEGEHGHHPKHGFAPAVVGTPMPTHVKSKMAPGRNQMHYAICDGCDKYISGVRHKCLDCPDWDYCSTCVKTVGIVHPKHRFVPIYEPLTDIQTIAAAQPVHVGICCDGPLCSVGKTSPSYIRGIRYKCAVCNDLDFCANCEASPSNEHNRTHPLIKFRTPVRHVSVTTTGERQDGKRLPTMGDRRATASPKVSVVRSIPSMSVNAIQTVVDVKPVAPATTPAPAPVVIDERKAAEQKPTVKQEKPVINELEELRASYVSETVVDGTVFPPNHVFEQTWTVRNTGKIPWPAGCSVKFVGGDYMGHVDPAHPAGIAELVSASESTVCYAPLGPGQEFPFTVLLRTPARKSKVVSYWRLSSPDGEKFGHRLWCDVNVRDVKPVAKAPAAEEAEVKSEESAKQGSTMIFPKLETESPVSSVHEESVPAQPEAESASAEEYDACGDDAEWDVSDDGFMTDEEYDILDASDDEYLEEQHNKKK